MKLKLALLRGGRAVDITLTADGTATAADVADALYRADPAAGGQDPGPVTLHVRDPFNANELTIPGRTTLAESSLLSGSSIAIAGATDDYVQASRGTPMARLRVLAGPDAGAEFSLPGGSSTIGRDYGADVRLSDPMVSKLHARINIGEDVEVIDLGSANGTIVSGDQVGRVVVSSSDVLVLGDTSLAVVHLQQQPRESGGGGHNPQIDHVRSPRVVPMYAGEKITAPTPPKVPAPQRFPVLAMLAPLLMGLLMWAFTKQLLGVIMMALSPLMLIGGYLDQRVSSKRQLKEARKRFDESMLRMQERLERMREEERRVRWLELPSTADLSADVRRLGPLLWTERPELPSFLTLNVGTGRMPARNVLELPKEQDTVAECWEQLLSLKAEYSMIERVPVVVGLRDAGGLGYTGPDAQRASIARAAMFQLVARHAPSELVVAAFVPGAALPEWEWLKWLPHTSSAHSPLTGPHLADGRGASTSLLAELEGIIDARLDEEPEPRGPIVDRTKHTPLEPVVPSVVVLVENAALADRGRLTRIAERGADVGVHVIWCAPRVEHLPAACRSYVELDVSGRDGIVGQVRLGDHTAPVLLETLAATGALELSRMLSPVVDVGTPDDDDSDLPRGVAYPDLAGVELLSDPRSVVERWQQNDSIIVRDGSAPEPRRKVGGLRAVIGHAGTEPFALDLRRDGPHALVGGTTGSGKSEFLQSWVLGMASAYGPDRLTFLFVDYKGGSAFADCVDLPHSVGLVTDLSPHLVRRALTSLKAELRYREHLLNGKRAKDLIALEKSGDPECPPSLVIVIDEFAALAQEVPEFVDGVVDVAQRGRSLGLHLIMATQRPAGVIKDNLRANTNLRIALRLADAEDSMDILGEKMAAYFDPSIPGRGAAKTGPGRIRVFQTGYVGGHTTGEPPVPRIDIEELDFGTHTRWEVPRPEITGTDDGPADITRIVTTIRRASSALMIPEPRKPWLNVLAPVYDFSRLPNPRTDARLLLGVIDDPEGQVQPPVFFEPDRDGNLAILGTGGSGKSTALRTLAVAAGATARNGGPTHVYGLDFGSRGLSMLDGLPHVGAIVSGDDEERVVRTIRMLRDLVDERATRYATANVSTIGEYRVAAGHPDEPRILLLIDGMGAFKEQYEFGPQRLSVWFTALAQIAADGRGVGVNLVMTGDRPNALPPSISSTVQRRIVLRMANEDEYVLLGVPKDVLDQASPPGRGIIDDKEMQIAILGETSNVAVQARELDRYARSLARLGGASPEPIRRLPEQVALSSLPAGGPEAPVIGQDDAALAPMAIEPRGALLLAGPPGSGRTTALATIAEAVRRAAPAVERILLAPRRTVLAHGDWSLMAQGAAEVAEAAQALTGRVEDGAARYAILIESLPEFTGTEAEFALDGLIRAAVREDSLVVGEGESSTWAQAYTLAQPFKAARRGILLAPGEMDGDLLLDTPLGRVRRADFPPGRGFLIFNGRAEKVQMAQVSPMP